MKHAQQLWKDRRGSEMVEGLVNIALMMVAAATLLSLLMYAFKFYEGGFYCRSMVRAVEVSGVYDQTQLQTTLNNLSGTNGKITMTAYRLNADGSKGAALTNGEHVQLRQSFAIELDRNYTVQVYKLGDTKGEINAPVRVKTAGMSEKYWRGESGGETPPKPPVTPPPVTPPIVEKNGVVISALIPMRTKSFLIPQGKTWRDIDYFMLSGYGRKPIYIEKAGDYIGGIRQNPGSNYVEFGELSNHMDLNVSMAFIFK